MTDLVLHPATQNAIERFVAYPSHGLAVYGVDGIGKTYLAEHIATLLLGITPTQLRTWAYFRMWSSDDRGTLSLEAAHEIVHFMKLKTTGSRTLRRVVIVEHANTLTTEAQNALLKMIEEPPLDTVLIVTAGSPESLLATIRSRVQSLYVRPPERSALLAASQSQLAPADSERLYLLANGLPGTYFALLQAPSDHPLLQAMQVAKELLTTDTFTRLAKIDSLANRDDTQRLIHALYQIAQTGIATSAKRGSQRGIQQWYAILSAAHTAEKQLAMSGSPKLVLADLLLHL